MVSKSPEERKLTSNSQNLMDLLEADISNGRVLYMSMVNSAARILEDYQRGEDAVQSLLVNLINGGQIILVMLLTRIRVLMEILE